MYKLSDVIPLLPNKHVGRLSIYSVIRLVINMTYLHNCSLNN